ncbi:MAG: WYL domain-containing protein [Candidatus Firestonebacteria bacterium]
MSTQAERIKRIFNLLPYLESKKRKFKDRIPLSDVLSDFGMNIKEFIKDLDVIMMCGIPPYAPDDLMEMGIEKDSISVVRNFFEKPGKLTLIEALMLYLGSEIIACQKGTKYAAIIESARRKIRRTLSKNIKEQLDKHKDQIGIDIVTIAIDRLQIIQQAIAERKKIEIEYYTKGRQNLNKRVISPYLAIICLDHWYIVGYCELAKEERTFRLDRIKSAKLTQDFFKLPEHFDKNKYGKYAPYLPTGEETEVKIKFSPKIARWITERAEKKNIKKLKDGSVILTIKSASQNWLIQEVLGYREDAEIISPPDFRKALKETCIQALKSYR